MRTLENALRRVGFVHVAGVDEVGRGCLAGPVVAAAWLASAAGSAASPLFERFRGTAPTAALMRILQGATVAAMGLLAGVIGIVAAYIACNAVHGGRLGTGQAQHRIPVPARSNG